MPNFVLITTTAGSADEAEQIASSLLEQRMAACVQIIPQIRSIYRWQDKIEKSEEWLCLIKTSRTLVGQVEAEVARLHSYDCPELVVVAIESGSKSYLSWLDAELQS